MTRIRIDIPGQFAFSCQIPVRITDINYGGHVGNDTLLSIIHEARMQYLASLGSSEMQFGGTGMIMSGVAIEFKNEIFYGDNVVASVAVGEITKVSFELIYMLETVRDNKTTRVANAKTTMICYDYEKKKIVAVPQEALKKLSK